MGIKPSNQDVANTSLCLGLITSNILLIPVHCSVHSCRAQVIGARCSRTWRGMECPYTTLKFDYVNTTTPGHQQALQRKRMREKSRANYKTFTSRRIIFFLQPVWRNENSVFMYSTANDSFLMMFGCCSCPATANRERQQKYCKIKWLKVLRATKARTHITKRQMDI